MKKILLTFLLTSSLSAHALETQDIVIKMVKAGDDYSVSFGSMAQIYQIKVSDKAVKCLEKSVEERKFVKITVVPENARIIGCK